MQTEQEQLKIPFVYETDDGVNLWRDRRSGQCGVWNKKHTFFITGSQNTKYARTYAG